MVLSREMNLSGFSFDLFFPHIRLMVTRPFITLNNRSLSPVNLAGQG